MKAEVGVVCQKNKEDFRDIIAPTEPRGLQYIAKKDLSNMVMRGGSIKRVAEAIVKPDEIIKEVVTKEFEVIEDKKTRGDRKGLMSIGEPHERCEGAVGARIGLGKARKSTTLEEVQDGSANEVPHTVVDIFKLTGRPRQSNSIASHDMNIVAKKKNGSLRLRTQSNQESRVTGPKPTPKRPLSNPQPRSTSPSSIVAKQPHPADIMKSFRFSTSTDPNQLGAMYSPVFNTQNSKARLTTPPSIGNKRSLTVRPKKTASVASRMITHALGIRPTPRSREPEVQSE